MGERPPAGAGTLGVGANGAFHIRFDRLLRHHPSRVWEALTTPAKLAVWLPGCSIDPRVGGEARFDFGDEGAATGTVLTLRPPTADGGAGELTHSWRWEGLPTSVVTWWVEPAAEGTRLLLDHRELIREPATDFAIGWHLILDALTGCCDGAPPDDAWGGAESLAAHYAGLI
ncbi:SRPBCC domain-containing protein [Streptomyces profundus]|uniref:SRPBCC domain-containing protein n=1 Tax=Streptomyces profundus TaxID=2867410 RepID=UPI001D1645C0|nr:SRPBCC domain-containing protein [Streptomyces sp. MA3_2.13]UED84561.1 SRPBCC domain-containing protein [Streptomyces sp. MA3_2.13]